MKKVILIGAAPLKDASFLKEEKDAFLVASDGGYRHFLDLGIEPDVLVGDFDTLDFTKILKPKLVLPLNPIKDDTDTFYVLKYLLKEGYREFHLHGCCGGKIEHTIANLELLSYLKDSQAQGYLYDEEGNNVLFLLDGGESIAFSPLAKGKLSVFSITEKSSGVTESNLKYCIKDATLFSSIPLGVSNEFVSADVKAKISLSQGRLLIIADQNALK